MIYQNLSGNSAVTSYDIDYVNKIIIVHFKNGSYHYRADDIGNENFEIMISKAKAGYGLGGFIRSNSIVRDGYFKRN